MKLQASNFRAPLSWGLPLALALGLLLSLCSGAVPLSPARLWNALCHSPEASNADLAILWHIRLPRTLLVCCVGAGLSLSGAAFQALFRNPLADPYVIGASSGAAFGVALAATFGGELLLFGLSPLPFAAFAGALGAVWLVYQLAGDSRRGMAALLLAGSAVGTLLSAVVSFLLIWREQPWMHIFGWLLGGFSSATWKQLLFSGPLLLLGGLTLLLLSRPLDLLSGGEECALSLGLPVKRTRLLLLTAASLCAAAAVSAAGIIGFVGLVSPHLIRLVFGAAHARLLPLCALAGAVLLLCADLAARLLLAPVEIPVGILTALIGAPFFLLLLKSREGGGQ